MQYSNGKIPESITEEMLIPYIQTILPADTKPMKWDEFLSCMSSIEEIDDFMEQAYNHFGNRKLSPEIGKALASRSRVVTGHIRLSSIKLLLNICIKKLAIPDPSRDELILHISIVTGASMEQLLDFMVDSSLIEERQTKNLKDKWLKNDTSLGNNDIEFQALEKCLSVVIDEIVAEHVSKIKYNFGISTKNIWRTCDCVITVHSPLELSNYPFDITRLKFKIKTYLDYDPSEIVIIEDPEAGPYLDISKSTQLRGFSVSSSKPHITPVVITSNRDELLQSIAEFDLIFKRKLNASVWRSLIPLLIIISLGVISTITGIIDNGKIESIQTQLLPSLLIAGIALQFTISQYVPAYSDGTLLDKLLVLSYIFHLFMFLTLELETQMQQYFTLSLFSFSYFLITLILIYKINRHNANR